MNSTQAQAEIMIILAKTAVGDNPASIIRYCKFMGADDEALALVNELLVAVDANDNG